MNNVLQQLQERNSAPRLIDPAPSGDVLESMFAAALRAPDHAWLQPWRFLVIDGESRQQLGELFKQALLRKTPDADQAAQDKAANAPQRAPLLVVVVCRYTEHPKVPAHEQLLSAGCAAHGLLLAAEAQGFAGVWRTGWVAEDDYIASELGLAANEEIIGFLYFGSRDGRAKSLPERKVENYVSEWTGRAAQ